MPTLLFAALQVERALELHTTDNVSVITVCFREGPPPPRRTQRQASPLIFRPPRVYAALLSLTAQMLCRAVCDTVRDCRDSHLTSLCSVALHCINTEVHFHADAGTVVLQQASVSMGRTLSKDALMLLNDALQPAACLPQIREQHTATAVRLTGL